MIHWDMHKITCPDEEIRLRCDVLYDNITNPDYLKDYLKGDRNTKAEYDDYNNKIKELSRENPGIPITIIYLIKATPEFIRGEDDLFVVHEVEYLNGKAKTLLCVSGSFDEVDSYLPDMGE